MIRDCRLNLHRFAVQSFPERVELIHLQTQPRIQCLEIVSENPSGAFGYDKTNPGNDTSAALFLRAVEPQKSECQAMLRRLGRVPAPSIPSTAQCVEPARSMPRA